MVAKGDVRVGGREIHYEFGINKYTLLYIKHKNKDLLYGMRKLYSISCNNI